MSKAQELKTKMESVKAELSKRTVSADAGAGMVTVVARGDLSIESVTIDPVMLADKAMLESLVKSAVNEALNRAKGMMEEEMKSLTGGMSIPGLF